MLIVDDFSAFVAEVHGSSSQGDNPSSREPFPWQQALLTRIVAEGRWPDVIDVPTGLGKTSVLDVAVFLAALRPDLARRRTFFVVDRRLVVDEAHEHAEKLRTALVQPRTEVCRLVAEALRASGDDGEPLTVTRMRGGVTWDRIWLERPDRFAVITGTVDQVGSRLLFRGYGVGEHARSLDAALVGTDSLIVVDEAHLAAAFRTTVAAALGQDRWPMAARLRPTLVTMSATSPTAASDAGSQRDAPTNAATPATAGDSELRIHRIGTDDERHPVAGARLRAGKRLRLVQVATTKKKATAELPRALATLAIALVDRGVVGVVVNTVSRARAVFELVNGTVDAMLLTGRSRPVDRDLLLDRHYDRIRVGRDRTDRRPFVLVATQTVEVGANIDLDALITESAPLPALVQRLGRLNRLGLHSTPAPAYVVHDSSADADDPVYGPARLVTWDWLASQSPIGTPRDPDGTGEGLDASPAALRELAAAAPALAGQLRNPIVPVLDAGTLDAWTCTSPPPLPDPPVAPYLHGLTDETPPVTVLWRAGLPSDQPWRWESLVDQVPPAAGETIDIPTREVRRWLLGEPAGGTTPLADIDVAEPAEDERGTSTVPLAGSASVERVRDGHGRPRVLRYAGRGQAELISVDRIRPGDTIVVPANYGGCDQYGWHAESVATVVDVADLARGPDRPLLRIGPHLRDLVRHTEPDPATVVSASPDPGTSATGTGWSAALRQLLRYATDDPQADRPDGYRELLDTLAEALAPTSRLRQLVQALVTKGWPAAKGGGRRTRCAVTPTQQVAEQTGAVWTPDYPVILTAAARTWSADDDSEAASSGTAYTGPRITLDGHQRAVAVRAAEMARNLGFPRRQVESVEAAARWHDEGKRDIRFQAMLLGGRRLAAELAPNPLAKSGLDPTNRAEARRAREAAGFPAGMRHEALSERIAALRLANQTRQGDDLDVELVLHLVASHHGRARRLLPPLVDPAPVQVVVPGLPPIDTGATVDLDAPSRFARLNDDYGRWGLALLETVVRLADIWCSVRDETVDTTSGTARARTGDVLKEQVEGAAAAQPVRHPVALPALDGRDLLGFLAALGTVRLLTEHADLDMRLSFDETTAGALLHGPLDSLDETVDALVQIVDAIPDNGVIPGLPADFPHAKVGTSKDPMRMPRDQLRAFWTGIDNQTPAVRRWLAALLTDLAVDAEGRAALTPYTAPVGQQSLRSFFEKPLTQVRRDPHRLIREALARWRRVDGYTGEYLDHRVLRGAADLPGGKPVEAGVPGATWLAIMALPLLRLTGTGARVRATLWHPVPGRRQPVMIWPLWRRPLDIEAITALLEHPELRPAFVNEILTVDPRCWPPLGVFTMAAAARRPMEERKSAGVLTPVSVTVARKPSPNSRA